MIKSPTVSFDESAELLVKALGANDVANISRVLKPLDVTETLEQLERLSTIERALAYRTLPKDRAMEVFERLDTALQADLVQGLQDSEVAEVFAALSPDDRVALMDELPASVANRLILGLDEKERALTSTVLGYPQGAVGRYMSPEFVITHPQLSVGRPSPACGPSSMTPRAFTRFRSPMPDGTWWEWCPCAMSCVRMQLN